MNQSSLGFKIGKHFLSVEDEHQKRHWTDSLKKVFVFAPKKEITIEKENKTDSEFRKPEVKQRSTSNLRENNFSFTLRRNLLKPKQNNIDYT